MALKEHQSCVPHSWSQAYLPQLPKEEHPPSSQNNWGPSHIGVAPTHGVV